MNISIQDIKEIILSIPKVKTSPFYTERDFVWTCQMELLNYIEPVPALNSHYMLTYEHPITVQTVNGGTKRYADLAIITRVGKEPVLIIEYKYEPNHNRGDIWSEKLPVVSINGITKDRDRIHEMVKSHKKLNWLFVLLDEGNHFKDKVEKIYNLFEDAGLDKSNVLIINDKIQNSSST